jgi:sulfatase modifying factor 1
VYDCTGDGATGCALTDILRVGSRSPKGDSKAWTDSALADLAGNLAEMTLDYTDFTTCCNAPYTSPTCNNCANLSPPALRVLRGGGFNDDASMLLSAARIGDTPSDRDSHKGVRCARNP